MSDRKIELNRRRVLGGIATVGIAAAAAGAGTFAAFSDTESSTNNQVSAGTLNLTVDGGNTAVEAVSINDAVPGDSGSGTLTLENTGNVDGTLDVSISNIASQENGTNEPESEAGDAGSSDGVELENELTVTISLAGTQLVSDTVNNLSTGTVGTQALNAGSSADLDLSYSVDSDAGNLIQSDSVTVDLSFTLTQA